MEQLTGLVPEQCPFAFKHDPFTNVAFAALRAWESGQLQLVWGPDPPAIVIEAVQLLQGAMNTGRAWVDDQREKKRKAAEATAQQK